MEIEKQVCNINYAERLKELGVTQKSLYYHTHSKFGVQPKQNIDFPVRTTSAFTCAELVQMNENIHAIHFSDRDKQFYSGSASDNDVFYYETFADALASKLLQALSKEWLSVDEANERLLK